LSGSHAGLEDAKNFVPTGNFLFFTYNFIHHSVHKYYGCKEGISVVYCYNGLLSLCSISLFV
jgi:hypothetical protein